ncbi:[Fe-S]-binding protein [Hahella sp. CCB-MM4]|uniref:HesB/IscA family protein n=1 Tax=Hahella sp. (strain CCB-MM4) TaxID=1926491 RepID=UPI000B9C1BDC|nr:iron-sulfur cluster assembly accessory protein [Hahella sp. CCB-MM4]OZG71170.1 [Fe-S]-binding protein [Hahella sp. CCB-MM4]
MSAQTFTPDVGLRITPTAAAHIRKQIERTPGTEGFRVGLKTSGCSGYMYVVDLVTQPQQDDRKFIVDGDITIFVDAKSLPLINGTEIDFVKEGLNSMFRFNNPNAESECGCGESISIRQEA